MEAGQPRKRYKANLDPNYMRGSVSPATDAAWSRKRQVTLPGIDDNEQVLNQRLPQLSLQFLPPTTAVERADNEDMSLLPLPPNSENNTCSDDNEDFTILNEGDNITISTDSNDDESVFMEPCALEDDVNPTPSVNRNTLIMFAESNLTVDDVMSMVAAFSLRFRTSNAARTNLVEMLKLCAGPHFASLNVSNHRFSKDFDPPDDVIMFNYYCTNCYTKLCCTFKKESKKNRQVVCEKCMQKCDVNSTSQNVFLSVDLKYQINLLLLDENICAELLESIDSRRVFKTSESLDDIQDSQLHRAVIEQFPDICTFNFSTDGAPLFHKSKRNFWPIQIILNDLTPKNRFKYVLLAGLMVVKKEPSPALMNLYLQTLCEQVNRLTSEGVSTVYGSIQLLFTFTPLCCSVDSVARPILQNRIQFNGYFGCSHCYQRGKYLALSMRYLFDEEEAEIRTHESHMRDVEMAITSSSLFQSRGIKGASNLSEIPNFDMVWGFPLDYMHTVLLGVVKFVWELWLKILSITQRKMIDERLKRIQPTREVHKLPETLSNRSMFKAKDWKAWLLYYSIPVCADIMEHKYLEHHAILVRSFYLLLQMKITSAEINECEENLLKYVAQFEILYGPQSMRFNVHSLIHVIESVKKSGPLWSTSAFPYESNIFALKQLVNGPKGVEQQMAKKSLAILSWRARMSSYSKELDPHVHMYCESIFSKQRATASAQVNNGVTFFGEGTPVVNQGENGKLHNRCIYQSQIYHSTEYKLSKNFNDTVVLLNCGIKAQINKIILFPETGTHLCVSVFAVEEVKIGECVIPHIWAVKSVENSILVPITDVHAKMVVVDIDVEQYVCQLPNVIEMD